jgi:hypothetical protein
MMALMRVVCVLWLLALLTGCAGDGAVAEPPSAVAHEGNGIVSNDGSYYVIYTTEPEAIPLNETFDVKVRIFDAVDRFRLLTDVRLDIDGRMPDHRHGMNREPRITRNDDGSFLVTGMLFHMPGYWELHFDITRDGATERAQAEVTLD